MVPADPSAGAVASLLQRLRLRAHAPPQQRTCLARQLSTHWRASASEACSQNNREAITFQARAAVSAVGGLVAAALRRPRRRRPPVQFDSGGLHSNAAMCAGRSRSGARGARSKQIRPTCTRTLRLRPTDALAEAVEAVAKRSDIAAAAARFKMRGDLRGRGAGSGSRLCSGMAFSWPLAAGGAGAAVEEARAVVTG